MFAFSAVSETSPESSALVVVFPDEVVDALGGDSEMGIGHDDLVRAEVRLKEVGDELSKESPNLDA